MTPTQTPFVGYEVLGPDDPLSSDGYRFQQINPLLADRMGRLGAETHRHDAHVAMANPTSAATTATTTGTGSFPSDQTVHVGYTLTDPDGGETLLSPVADVAMPAGYSTPGAPTLALDHAAGTLLAANVSYAVTVRDGRGGETELSAASAVVIPPGFANSEVTLSALNTLLAAASGSDPSATWAAWRQIGGGPWYLIGTGTGATLVDNGIAGDCTVTPPAVSTTTGTNSLLVSVAAAGQPPAAVNFSIYAALDPSFTDPCLMGTYPVSDFGVVKTYVGYLPLAGSPPPVSTCYGGANKIDPDTDILNWTWKRTVADFASLPSVGNTAGDARVTLDAFAIYIWNGSAWGTPPSASAPWKGTVANVAALPGSGNTDGDVRVTLDTHEEFEWNGSAWVNVPEPAAPPVSLPRATPSTALTGLTTATETAETLVAPGKGSLLYAVTVDAACHVRLYPTAAIAVADIARADSADPNVAAQNGCLVEVVFVAAGTKVLTPGALAVNQEGSPAANLAANVRVDGGGTDVTVTLAGYALEL